VIHLQATTFHGAKESVYIEADVNENGNRGEKNKHHHYTNQEFFSGNRFPVMTDRSI
jgi:hypothetical protein